MNPPLQKTFFKTSDNLTLTGIWHFPQKNNGKVIVLAHGITVDKDEGGVFVELANFLNQHGYAVFRFDFRGSGESDGNSIDMTVSGEVKDLEAATNYVQSQGYQDVGLLAASFGGSVASFYVAQNSEQIKSLCLWNPVLNYDHTFVSPTLPWIIDKVGQMKSEIKDQGWTTLGRRKFVIGKNLWEELEEVKPYEELRSIKCSALIIHGDKDTYVPYEDSKGYVDLLENGALVTVEGGEHGFHRLENGEEQAQQETLEFFEKYL